jgi:hypothetical protein
MSNRGQTVRSTVAQLTTYLQANPLACDSVEGIANWWLAECDAGDLRVVERALSALTAAGFVEAVVAIDGRVRYRGRLSQARGPSQTRH